MRNHSHGPGAAPRLTLFSQRALRFSNESTIHKLQHEKTALVRRVRYVESLMARQVGVPSLQRPAPV
jgi:hypothetical protein